MMDSADPSCSWSADEVSESAFGCANNDLYGKLHQHVSNTLQKFWEKLMTKHVSFDLLNVNAILLSKYVDKDSFARIEVSKIVLHIQVSRHRSIPDCQYLRWLLSRHRIYSPPFGSFAAAFERQPLCDTHHSLPQRCT